VSDNVSAVPDTSASSSSKPIATTLAPLLSVRRGAAALDFYKIAFGADELFRVVAENGAIVARMAVAGAEFWVADESPAHLNFSPESLGGGTVRLILTVADPDIVFAQAITAGATVVWPVNDQSYGWRVGRLVDPFGHHWEIGRPLCDGPDAPPSPRPSAQAAGKE
jgi:PhnB protein